MSIVLDKKQAEEQAAIKQINAMIRGRVISLQTTSASEEFFTATAEHYKKVFDAFVAQGFTKAEALELTKLVPA